MKQTHQLANRLREVVLNGTWIANTNYKAQLEGMDWKVVTTKIDALNSIAMIAQHVHYYIHGIKNVFEGGDLDIKDKFSFDFPPIESQTAWETFLSQFWKDTEKLVDLIAILPEEKLKHAFVDEKYGTFSRNIDGMIEHCYYHLGQIVLIKKLLQDNRGIR